MPILDVTRNRHLESDGQEVRVRHDFLPHFFSCLSYTLEGARANTGLSLLCVDVGYKQWSNDRPICA